MTHMKGFSEQGQPDNWDMAVGSVRGFRWWRLVLTFRYVDPWPTARYIPRMSTPLYISDYSRSPESVSFRTDVVAAGQSWLPDIDQSMVLGMYNGTWQSMQRDEQDRYLARCAITRYVKSVRIAEHTPYTPDPGCGCGFWAYWNGLPEEFSGATMPCATKQGQELKILLPLGGVIEGSGHVIIGENGFRSEYARITDVAIRTSGQCQYTDLDEQSQDYNGLAGWPSRPAGEFLPFITGMTGLPAWKITEEAWNAIEWCLGKNYNSYRDVETLWQHVKKDENYAT